MSTKADILKTVCEALTCGDQRTASEMARELYPFAPQVPAGRTYLEAECMTIFTRDGFTDRYSGSRLVFPGSLRLLSRLLPAEFPFHPNWKMTETHPAYWELFPTIDHVEPLCRGGSDVPENRVTTSMLRNGAKGNWTLEELGWRLVPPGKLSKWDGLLGWFRAFVDREPVHLEDDGYLRRWHSAAKLANC